MVLLPLYENTINRIAITKSESIHFRLQSCGVCFSIPLSLRFRPRVSRTIAQHSYSGFGHQRHADAGGGIAQIVVASKQRQAEAHGRFQVEHIV